MTPLNESAGNEFPDSEISRLTFQFEVRVQFPSSSNFEPCPLRNAADKCHFALDIPISRISDRRSREKSEEFRAAVKTVIVPRFHFCLVRLLSRVNPGKAIPVGDTVTLGRDIKEESA